MTQQMRSRRDASPAIRTFYEADPPMVVIDFGAGSTSLKTDIIDDTLIVIDESTDEQFEYTIPREHQRMFMQNGVLTIEVEE